MIGSFVAISDSPYADSRSASWGEQDPQSSGFSFSISCKTLINSTAQLVRVDAQSRMDWQTEAGNRLLAASRRSSSA